MQTVVGGPGKCSTSGRTGTRSSASLGRPVCSAARTLARVPRKVRSSAVCVHALLKPADKLKVTWDQTTDEVLIKVPVAADVKGKDVKFEVHPKRLQLQAKGSTLLEGSLADAGEVDIDGCFWTIENEGGERMVVITLAKKTMGYGSWEQLLTADAIDTSITHRVFMDVKIGDRLHRLVIGLFGNVVPKTAENFKALCTGEKGSSSDGTRLSFQGSPFHRIIPGFMAQGGDITLGNGMGGESIYGPSFQDENFKLKHEGRGCLAMANAGPNTNSSQFYITFAATPHLDGKHVVFGKVEAGFDTLAALEAVGAASGTPSEEVVIVSSGDVPLAEDPKEFVLAFKKEQQQQQSQQTVASSGPQPPPEGAAPEAAATATATSGEDMQTGAATA